MRLSGVLRWGLLFGLAAFMAAPFLWMILVSLHPPKSPIPSFAELVPAEPAWGSYGFVLFHETLPIARFFLNSLFVSAAVVAGQLLICSLAAYGFSRFRFPGRELVFGLFLASMMLSGAVTQIPVFLLMRGLGWLDTYAALIVPGLSSAFSIFLLRQFFAGVPLELDEAAKIDGAGELRIWAQIVMPLSRTALATAAAFTFFAVWTDFFWPLLSTTSVRMRTLEVGLSVFKDSYGGTNWPLQMTAAVITLVPLIAVFLLVQRWFVRGIMLGGVK